MKLNPNHPVTKAADSQWHKLAALIMLKLGIDHVTITPADIEEASARPEGLTIVVQTAQDSIQLRLVGNEEAEELARKAGGTPQQN